MQSVGGSYDARLGRVISARGLLEGQIQQQLVLLEGYSRIASMIEIEVEMNTSVRPLEFLCSLMAPAELSWIGAVVQLVWSNMQRESSGGE